MSEAPAPPRTRRVASIAVAVAILSVVVLAGFVVVRARSGGGGASEPSGTVFTPTPAASASSAPVATWLVAKAKGKVSAYAQPDPSAAVRATLPKLNAHGYPTLMLVQKVRDVEGVTWYDVALPVRPNGSSGWVRADSVGTYETTASIVVDVSARQLSVYRGGSLLGRFRVAVGSSTYPTPSGLFYVAEKVRPKPAGSMYGVLALGLNGFQPKLPALGPLAIHGTNDDAGIGRAITKGCLRLHNADVLKVSAWVRSGSPVVIHR